jgi:hypothetical protein
VQSSHLLLLCFASTERTEFRESYVPDECLGLREEGGNCGAEKALEMQRVSVEMGMISFSVEDH